MRDVLYLAWRYLGDHRLKTAILVTSIMLIIYLPIGLTGDLAQIAGHLIERAPDGIGWVYFMSGGSEAIEAALKMARQYFLETGEAERTRFIARRQSYHGNTLGALAAGGNAWRREPFEPMLMDVGHIAPCYAFRDRSGEETEEAYGLRVAD